MRLSGDLSCRLCRLVFTTVIALAWAGIANGGPAETGSPATDGITDPTPEQLRAAASQVEETIHQFEAADRELPRDTFDPQAIVGQVGRNPGKLAAWVREQTSWVPYHGVLRGPVGVLMDRLGNSLDRSLLLARLLQISGATARLAQANLSEAQAKELLKQVIARQHHPVTAPAIPPDQNAAIDDYAKAHGLDPAELRRNVAKLTAPFDRMAEDVAQRVAEQTPLLLQAIGQPQVPKPSDQGTELDALRDHWWVQYRDGDKWRDLDPLMVETKSREPQQTVDFDVATGKFALDAKLYHQVRVRAVIEQWKHGKLGEARVLDQPLRVAEMVGRRVSIGHLPADWPGDLDLLGDKDPAGRLRAAVMSQHEWVPLLQVGSESISQQGFLDTGEIDPKPNLDAMAKLSKGVGAAASRITGAFDALNQPEAPKPNAAGVLTAEWLEFEISSPGRATRTMRREVFDLLGPVTRSHGIAEAPTVSDRQRFERGLILLGTTEMLPLGCQLSPEFVQHVAISNLVENRGPMLELLRNGGSDTKKAMDQIGKLSPLPASLYNWGLARAAWSRHRDDIYLDQPNLVCLHRQIRADQQEQPVVRAVLDIVANPVAVRPGVDADPFVVRLEQGVVDTNVEAVVLRQQSPSVNTSEFFARAAAQGMKWVTLRPGQDNAAWRDLKIPDDVRSRIERDLAAGYEAVAAQGTIEISGRPVYGWWRVDPLSGESLGMNEFGGATMVEYAGMIAFGILTAFYTYWGCGGFAAGASTGKKLGCAVCAVAMGVVAAFALGAAAGMGGAVAAGGKALGSFGGVAGVGFGGMACNALSGGAS